jgi:hypothetical protein
VIGFLSAIRRGRAFGRKCRNVAAACQDHINIAADEVSCQCRQPIIATLRPTVFDRYVLAFDPAGFAQPLANPGHERRTRPRRPQTF